LDEDNTWLEKAVKKWNVKGKREKKDKVTRGKESKG
jgi:hypothetical protein